MNIIKFLVDFRGNNSDVWVENNNIKLFISDDFENYEEAIATIKAFKSLIVDCLIANKIISREDFRKKTIFKDDSVIIPLSFAQERLWFIEQYEQGTNAYHI